MTHNHEYKLIPLYNSGAVFKAFFPHGFLKSKRLHVPESSGVIRHQHAPVVLFCLLSAHETNQRGFWINFTLSTQHRVHLTKKIFCGNHKTSSLNEWIYPLRCSWNSEYGSTRLAKLARWNINMKRSSCFHILWWITHACFLFAVLQQACLMRTKTGVMKKRRGSWARLWSAPSQSPMRVKLSRYLLRMTRERLMSRPPVSGNMSTLTLYTHYSLDCLYKEGH